MENKKMNLIELMLEYKKNNSFKCVYGLNRLPADQIKSIEHDLLQLTEFSNVKKINVIKGNGTTFISDEKGVPLDISDTYVGGKVMFNETVAYEISENNSNIFFNEEIDILDIELTDTAYDFYDIEKTPFGVWKNPTVYPTNGDKKYNSVVIKWNNGNDFYMLKEFGVDMNEKIKKNILSKVEELLNDEALPNTPSKHCVKIRVSNRSIKK